MGKEKKKYESGAATNYISRSQAIRRLQLSLKDFRRLCILKGIYPHEPRHKKKVNKGSTENKTWYYAKDILFLAHEPIIQKFRDQKAFLKKLKKFEIDRESEKVDSLKYRWPKYKLDHVVRERYPSMLDSVRDLDDALSLMFLFARLPSDDRIIPASVTRMCRRLALEFLHYVIAAKCLSKVFVSIKGIYYQAEIMGERVTWIVQHDRAYQEPQDVDFAVMATFVEFYTALLGFVNFGLFKKLGLHYPPKLEYDPVDRRQLDDDPELKQEMIYSLTRSLFRDGDVREHELNTIDEFPIDPSDESLNEAQRIQQATARLPQLFKGCVFLLSREVPKESMTFIIRSCGGEVSWQDGYGKNFGADDSRITHVVIDRPSVANRHIARSYVQPQWVYDSINSRSLLPVAAYMPGQTLPPHLSPFTEEKPGDYVPPERIAQLKLAGYDTSSLEASLPVTEERKRAAIASEPKPKKKRIDPVAVEEAVEAEDGKSKQKSAVITPGKIRPENPQKRLNEVGEQRKLREMMLAKKHTRVYHKITKGRKKNAKAQKKLASKRVSLEATS